MYQEVKIKSRESLANFKGKAAIFTLLFFLLPEFLNRYFATGILGTLTLILAIFCKLGVLGVFFYAARDNDLNFGNMILKAKNYFNLIIGSIIISIICAIIVIPITLLILFGSFGLTISAGLGSNVPISVVIGTILLIILLLVLVLCIFIRYYTFFSMAIERDDCGAIDLLKESKEMMSGYRVEALLMELSFIPWYLLVIVTVGIASLYVIPYTYLARVNFYLKLTEANRIKVEKETVEVF